MADKTDPVEETAEQQETQDARLDRVEATQAEQGGKLDQILGLLQGESGGQSDAHEETTADGAESIAEQVRRAVEAVGAEKAAKEAEDAHKADHAALREAREKPPRESQSGFRGKLQRAMFGADQ